MIRSEIRKAIETAVRGAFGEITIPEFLVERPENPEHGDYATNIAMLLARVLKKIPLEIAKEIVKKISDKRFEKVETIAPGFINIRLKDDFFVSQIMSIDETWGNSDAGKGKTVIVEYFQLNIGKPPHVGHLRSAVIGDSIKRMLLSQGYNAISDTHVGDWGTQFGNLIYAYKHAGEEKQREIDSLLETDPYKVLEKLELLYKQLTDRKLVQDGNKFYRKVDPNEKGKKEFVKLEQGDVDNKTIWKKILKASMGVLEQSASLLVLQPFDEHRGESFYEKDTPGIVKNALENGVAKKLPGGAIVVDLSGEGLDEAVLIKSDGASTYLLRDLATIKYRKEHWKFSQNLYVVDIRQSHHFRQLFRVAELLGFEGVGESQHVAFGFMSLPGGVFSTRKGNVIHLKTLIEVASEKVKGVIKQKNPALKNASGIADAVGLGVVKYFDLSHHRQSDIVFRWKDALAFEGNTGPYLQYTHARLKSILKKAGYAKSVVSVSTLDSVEHTLISTILQFPEVIEDALKDYTPNTLANFLYILASRANEFYHSHPVIQETNEEKKLFRLVLVAAIAQTLKKGLYLLGIDAPEEM